MRSRKLLASINSAAVSATRLFSMAYTRRLGRRIAKQARTGAEIHDNVSRLHGAEDGFAARFVQQHALLHEWVAEMFEHPGLLKDAMVPPAAKVLCNG